MTIELITYHQERLSLVEGIQAFFNAEYSLTSYVPGFRYPYTYRGIRIGALDVLRRWGDTTGILIPDHIKLRELGLTIIEIENIGYRQMRTTDSSRVEINKGNPRVGVAHTASLEYVARRRVTEASIVSQFLHT